MQDKLQTVSEILNNLSPDISFDANTDCDVTLSDLGVDSLDNMSLFLEIQEKFGIAEIADSDIDKLISVKLILDYIEKHLDKAA